METSHSLVFQQGWGHGDKPDPCHCPSHPRAPCPHPGLPFCTPGSKHWPCTNTPCPCRYRNHRGITGSLQAPRGLGRSPSSRTWEGGHQKEALKEAPSLPGSPGHSKVPTCPDGGEVAAQHPHPAAVAASSPPPAATRSECHQRGQTLQRNPWPHSGLIYAPATLPGSVKPLLMDGGATASHPAPSASSAGSRGRPHSTRSPICPRWHRPTEPSPPQGPPRRLWGRASSPKSPPRCPAEPFPLYNRSIGVWGRQRGQDGGEVLGSRPSSSPRWRFRGEKGNCGLIFLSNFWRALLAEAPAARRRSGGRRGERGGGYKRFHAVRRALREEAERGR